MKPAIVTCFVGLGLALGLSSCAPPPAQRDTGNMAYPAPLPQGNVSTTATTTRTPTDTGNMAYPAPLPQGNISTTVAPPRSRDTGNMAYPAPLPQGTVSRTTIQ